MSTILLVEDEPDLGTYEVGMLEAAGHTVLRCAGGGTLPSGGCPLLLKGRCMLPDAADLVIFSVPLYLPLRGRTYRGEHLLHAYRGHAAYGRLPFLVVSTGDHPIVGGSGPIAFVEKWSSPNVVIDAVEDLLTRSGALA